MGSTTEARPPDVALDGTPSRFEAALVATTSCRDAARAAVGVAAPVPTPISAAALATATPTAATRPTLPTCRARLRTCPGFRLGDLAVRFGGLALVRRFGGVLVRTVRCRQQCGRRGRPESGRPQRQPYARARLAPEQPL
jgi:hypothetical protein